MPRWRRRFAMWESVVLDQVGPAHEINVITSPEEGLLGFGDMAKIAQEQGCELTEQPEPDCHRVVDGPIGNRSDSSRAVSTLEGFVSGYGLHLRRDSSRCVRRFPRATPD